MASGPRLLAAPDKFRGTVSAAEAARALCAGAVAGGWRATALPLSDGGEGLVDCLGGVNRWTDVPGPLGGAVRAGWRLDGNRAVIEMAAASGLSLVDGANDPVRANTTGTGRLIAAAIAAGARTVVVGAGGSATTDGGLGAVEALQSAGGVPPGVELIVAADVTATFVEAAPVFAPQKGADPEQVQQLTSRLQVLGDDYLRRFGVDVLDLPGAGAAGGLAGGLAALGAAIRPGFEVVAELLDLATAIRSADLVVTGEGRLDATSLLGKTPVGVARLCAAENRPVAVIAGEVVGVDARAVGATTVVSLTADYGPAARTDTIGCLTAASRRLVDQLPPPA
jgi:glycerate kinase